MLLKKAHKISKFGIFVFFPAPKGALCVVHSYFSHNCMYGLGQDLTKRLLFEFCNSNSKFWRARLIRKSKSEMWVGEWNAWHVWNGAGIPGMPHTVCRTHTEQSRASPQLLASYRCFPIFPPWQSPLHRRISGFLQRSIDNISSIQHPISLSCIC